MKYLDNEKNKNFYLDGSKLYNVYKGYIDRVDCDPALDDCGFIEYKTGVSVWHNGIVGNKYRQDVEFFNNKGDLLFDVSEKDFDERVTLFPGTVTDKGVFVTIRFIGEQQFGLEDYKPDITRFYYYNGNRLESENFNELIERIEGKEREL